VASIKAPRHSQGRPLRHAVTCNESAREAKHHGRVGPSQPRRLQRTENLSDAVLVQSVIPDRFETISRGLASAK